MKIIIVNILLVTFSFSLSAQHPFIISHKKTRASFNTQFRPLLNLSKEYDSHSEFIEKEYFDVSRIEEVENVYDLKKIHESTLIGTVRKSSSGVYSNETKKAVKNIITMAENDSHTEPFLINEEIKNLRKKNDQIHANSDAENDKYNQLYKSDMREAEKIRNDIERLQSNIEYLANNIKNQQKSVQWAQNTYNSCKQNSTDCTLQYNNLVSYKNTLHTMTSNYNKSVYEERDKRNSYNNQVENFNKAKILYDKKLDEFDALNHENIKKNDLKIVELNDKKYTAYFNYYNSQKTNYIKKRKEDDDVAIKKMKEFGGTSDDLYKIQRINSYANNLFESLKFSNYTPMVQLLDEIQETGKNNPNSHLGNMISTINNIKIVLDDFVTAFDKQAPPFLKMQYYKLTNDAKTNVVLRKDRNYLIEKFKSEGDNIIDVYNRMYRQSKIEISGWNNIHFVFWFENLPNLTYLSLESDVVKDAQNFKNLTVSTLKIKAGNSARLEGMSKMPNLRKVIITANMDIKKKEIKAFCDKKGIASENCIIEK